MVHLLASACVLLPFHIISIFCLVFDSSIFLFLIRLLTFPTSFILLRYFQSSCFLSSFSSRAIFFSLSTVPTHGFTLPFPSPSPWWSVPSLSTFPAYLSDFRLPKLRLAIYHTKCHPISIFSGRKYVFVPPFKNNFAV